MSFFKTIFASILLLFSTNIYATQQTAQQYVMVSCTIPSGPGYYTDEITGSERTTKNCGDALSNIPKNYSLESHDGVGAGAYSGYVVYLFKRN